LLQIFIKALEDWEGQGEA